MVNLSYSSRVCLYLPNFLMCETSLCTFQRYHTLYIYIYSHFYVYKEKNEKI